MRRVVVLVAIALLLGTAAAWATFAFTSRSEQRALVGFEQTQVYQSLTDIPAATSLASAIEQGWAGLVDFPAGYAPENILTDVGADSAEVVTSVDIPAGRLLLTGDFAQPEVAAEALLSIPDNEAAVSLSLTDPQRVGTFLQPGSLIAIFHSSQTISLTGEPITRTELLLDGVRVLAVGDVSADSSAVPATSNAVPSTLVTVGVPIEHVQRLVHSATTGTLYFALLSPTSTVPDQPPITTTGQ